MDYKPSGVCSRLIHVELDGDKIANVEFVGGCAGNTAGISSLVKGMDAHEVIKRLEGTKCGARPTSCPDQLSKALTGSWRIIFCEFHNYRKKGYLSSPYRGRLVAFYGDTFFFMYSYCKISIFIQCFVYLLQLLLF